MEYFVKLHLIPYNELQAGNGFCKKLALQFLKIGKFAPQAVKAMKWHFQKI